jgi:cobalt/nickel transport protein
MKQLVLIVVGLIGWLSVSTVQGHFQELIPSTDIVTEETDKAVELTMVFTHPMEGGPVMEMAEPVQFGVLVNGEKEDLKSTLETKKMDGKTTYTATYQIKGPADYVFYIEPAPYWEPAEEKYITHYTKVVVDAFGAEEGWDTLVGFPVEIEPLVRPYGLWAGNLFRGVVKQNGEPVPFAEIEVEYRNADGEVAIPAEPFITQVIKADADGIFSYAMPRAGWWSFAALIEGEPRQGPEGGEVGHELGALMWVKTVDMQ